MMVVQTRAGLAKTMMMVGEVGSVRRWWIVPVLCVVVGLAGCATETTVDGEDVVRGTLALEAWENRDYETYTVGLYTMLDEEVRDKLVWEMQSRSAEEPGMLDGNVMEYYCTGEGFEVFFAFQEREMVRAVWFPCNSGDHSISVFVGEGGEAWFDPVRREPR
jgi:hypothetical protein